MRVLVLDITGISATLHYSYDPAMLRLAGLRQPGHDARRRLVAAGAEYLAADALNAGDDALLNEANEDLLSISARSAMATFFRTDRLVHTGAQGRLWKALRREGRQSYRFVRARFSELGDGIESVFLPNGRFPAQQMAAAATKDAGLLAMHYERGETPDTAFLQPYSPHDRIANQEEVAKRLAGLSVDDVDRIAQAWLDRRAPAADSSNEFAELWNRELPAALNDRIQNSNRVVGIFTSSQDEFAYLGPEWQLHSWADQFEAFEAVLRPLETAGWTAYLRVHPNLATKRHENFLREHAAIKAFAARHPDLLVFWHNDSANSYQLIEASDLVVTWGSTIGLEASARGIPVISTGATRYGLVADIHEVLSAEDLAQRPVATWEVDPSGARRFVATLVLRDEPLSTSMQDWTPWDLENPPRAVRYAAALASGGAPSRREAIRSILDFRRQRRWKN